MLGREVAMEEWKKEFIGREEGIIHVSVAPHLGRHTVMDQR